MMLTRISLGVVGALVSAAVAAGTVAAWSDHAWPGPGTAFVGFGLDVCSDDDEVDQQGVPNVAEIRTCGSAGRVVPAEPGHHSLAGPRVHCAPPGHCVVPGNVIWNSPMGIGSQENSGLGGRRGR